MSTYVRGEKRYPACGGGYLRLFPFGYTRRAFDQLNAAGHGAIVYLHPYEIETRPQVDTLPGLTFKERLHFHFFNFHQKVNRGTTEWKLRALFERYRFGTIAELVAALPA